MSSSQTSALLIVLLEHSTQIEAVEHVIPLVLPALAPQATVLVVLPLVFSTTVLAMTLVLSPLSTESALMNVHRALSSAVKAVFHAMLNAELVQSLQIIVLLVQVV